MIFFSRNRPRIPEIDPDEIFLDSHNSPSFDQQQFEGRIERPISKRTIFFLGLLFSLAGVLFAGKVAALQLYHGEQYVIQSKHNRYDIIPLFTDRGIIYDRYGEELATNATVAKNEIPVRSYIEEPGFAHLLGYVSYPKKDEKGFFWQDKIIGKDGVEKEFNAVLEGGNGVTYIERNAHGDIQTQNIVEPPTYGENITLSIDKRIQAKLFESIVNLSKAASFEGGAGVLMDVATGEIIALTSFPEYDPEILSLGSDRITITSYIHDSRKIFLNRVVSGLYTPGSIVKPFIAAGALTEGIIDPDKKIISTGSIAIPNPYNPELKTIFNDWKAHGWVDLRKAIAVSSNIYFYAIGGGFEDQSGLGVDRIKKYTELFALGKKTGINIPGEIGGTIPSREWKEKNFPGDPWRIGDTYNTAIGQYGFQVTPIQMVRSVASIANGGKLVTPTILAGQNPDVQSIDIQSDILTIIQEAMRLTVIEGTGTSLNIDGVTVAVKTGTAQVGISKRYMNSWSVGFFPYEKPAYAFVVLMERGPKANTIGASHAMRELLLYMREATPEYFVIH